MSEKPRPYHGGDPAALMARFADAPRPWIDLSTGINPWAYPMPDIPVEHWRRLPTAADLAGLLDAAAARYCIKAGDTVVAAPGTESLIQLLPLLRPPGHVAVLGPTYAEHARAWARHGHEVAIVPEPDAGADVVVLVNPDNPTGRTLSSEKLYTISKRLQNRGGLLVVDEAFADLMPDGTSLIPSLPENATVLRSFGKTYGLAGLRLGFAVAPEEIAARIADLLGPWAVSGPAIALGKAALRDAAWLEETRTNCIAAAARLDALLMAAGQKVVGGTPLFRLVESPDAERLIEKLGRAGIHIRSFAERPGQLRFGLPGPDDQWHRLERALADYRSAPGSR